MNDLTGLKNCKLLELVWQEPQSQGPLNCLVWELPYHGPWLMQEARKKIKHLQLFRPDYTASSSFECSKWKAEISWRRLLQWYPTLLRAQWVLMHAGFCQQVWKTGRNYSGCWGFSVLLAFSHGPSYGSSREPKQFSCLGDRGSCHKTINIFALYNLVKSRFYLKVQHLTSPTIIINLNFTMIWDIAKNIVKLSNKHCYLMPYLASLT
jgi:hypothetical protein